MSAQWGHGFHTGVDKGQAIGEQVGRMFASEVAWHCINAAISALQSNNEMQALALLRLLANHLREQRGISNEADPI